MTGMLGLDAAAQASPWTTVGFWLIGVGAAYLLFLAARAFVNPKGFAVYLGLPLSDPADTGFVYVYAARSTFISLLAVALLVRRDMSVLSMFALLAVPMPVTDAILVSRAHAGAATVARHSIVAVFLFVASVLLWLGI
jgi:hypothetical protein